MSDLLTCAGCGELHQGLAPAELPDGWDALFISGAGWRDYCAGCVAAGIMESERAYRSLPRRADWRLPLAVVALYRPAAREVLIAVPGGMASIPEDDAEKLRDALSAALAVRDVARGMAA